MKLRRHWPLLASLLLSASGCADTPSQAGSEPISEHSELTFTAVPVGAGERIALDRDSDGKLDAADLDDHADSDFTWDWSWSWED